MQCSYEMHAGQFTPETILLKRILGAHGFSLQYRLAKDIKRFFFNFGDFV